MGTQLDRPTDEEQAAGARPLLSTPRFPLSSAACRPAGRCPAHPVGAGLELSHVRERPMIDLEKEIGSRATKWEKVAPASEVFGRTGPTLSSVARRLPAAVDPLRNHGST